MGLQRFGTGCGMGRFHMALADPVLRQQAAILATSLAARPDVWLSCYEQLRVDENAFLEVVYDAFALGWRLKWT